MLRPIFILWLEAKRYLTDRGDLAFSLALPIVLFALFYGAFGGEVTFRGTAHVVDLDRGPLAQELVTRLESVDELKVDMLTEEEADRDLDRSRIVTAFVIPAGFSEGLRSGEPVSLTWKRRGSGGDEGQIVAAIVEGVAQRMAGEFQVRHAVNRTLADGSLPQAQVDQTVSRLIEEARAEPPVGLDLRAIGGGEDQITRLLAGILTMFLMFAVTLGAQSLVGERRLGTLERLLTTRLTINQLFLGKFFAGVSRATLQAILLLSLAFAVLRVAGPTTFVQALAFSLLFAGTVSAIGLVISGLARTQDQAAWSAVFLTLTMTVFGGTFIDPGDSGPLALLSRLTVSRYAIDALDDILTGTAGIAEQGPEAAVLAAVMVVSLVLARTLFSIAQRRQ